MRKEGDKKNGKERRMGRKQIRGKVRGGGVPVEVETGSGNIEIQ